MRRSCGPGRGWSTGWRRWPTSPIRTRCSAPRAWRCGSGDLESGACWPGVPSAGRWNVALGPGSPPIRGRSCRRLVGLGGHLGSSGSTDDAHNALGGGPALAWRRGSRPPRNRAPRRTASRRPPRPMHRCSGPPRTICLRVWRHRYPSSLSPLCTWSPYPTWANPENGYLLDTAVDPCSHVAGHQARRSASRTAHSSGGLMTTIPERPLTDSPRDCGPGAAARTRVRPGTAPENGRDSPTSPCPSPSFRSCRAA